MGPEHSFASSIVANATIDLRVESHDLIVPVRETAHIIVVAMVEAVTGPSLRERLVVLMVLKFCFGGHAGCGVDSLVDGLRTSTAWWLYRFHVGSDCGLVLVEERYSKGGHGCNRMSMVRKRMLWYCKPESSPGRGIHAMKSQQRMFAVLT